MRRINQWREIQLAYMPAIGSLVANTTTKLLSEMESGTSAVEDIPLFLPSSLPLSDTTSGFTTLLTREVRLRIAQADDALADIRHHLRIISGLWQFKKVNVSGTGNQPNTRMRTLFNRLSHRMKGSVMRYRTARSALLLAVPGGEWKDRLKDLKDIDIRGPGKDDFYMHQSDNILPGGSKGRFEISWIWLVPRPSSEVEANSSEQVFDEGMRVEWSKSQARRNRWEEEVYLIQEEMRRTIKYYEWRELWWLEKEVTQSIGDGSIQHGITAYAYKQAYYCKCLAESFAIAWLPFLESEGITPEWRRKYDRLIANKKARSISIPVEHLPYEDTETNIDKINKAGRKEREEEEEQKEEDDEEEDEEEEEEKGYRENNIYDTFELDD